MKKILILLLAMAASYGAFAQPKNKANYMNITIYMQRYRFTSMIVTRTDSAQEVKKLDINLFDGNIFTGNAPKILAKQDSTTMQLLKPYYDKGWKLSNSSIDAFTAADGGVAYKYYLVKEE